MVWPHLGHGRPYDPSYQLTNEVGGYHVQLHASTQVYSQGEGGVEMGATVKEYKRSVAWVGFSEVLFCSFTHLSAQLSPLYLSGLC